jgi:hypothetical protein
LRIFNGKLQPHRVVPISDHLLWIIILIQLQAVQRDLSAFLVKRHAADCWVRRMAVTKSPESGRLRYQPTTRQGFSFLCHWHRTSFRKESKESRAGCSVGHIQVLFGSTPMTEYYDKQWNMNYEKACRVETNQWPLHGAKELRARRISREVG